MEQNNGRQPLNTQKMQEKLKGDTFPDDWGEFLDDDIRIFFDDLFVRTRQRRSDVIRKANISRTYGYQIMEGRRIGKRDYYIAIAIAMSLDLSMTQRLLGVTRSGVLHPLVKRDAAIIFAINHGFGFERLYDFMCELELPPLDTGLLDDSDE